MRLINILGIKINVLTKKRALVEIEKLLAGQGQHYLVTPNPEIILQATSHDEEFFYILNQADLALSDGIGLKIAAWFMGINLPRVTGVDLVKDILELAQSQGRRVAVFNWQGGLSSEPDIRQALADKYPGLPALVIGIDRQAVIPEQQLALAGEFQPEIIFSCLGAPWQEKFIFHNLAKLPSVKIGVGVGGALDFLSGRIRRAPKILRIIGLEWLWRLIKQPKRWRRIFNAVIVFPYKFLFWRFILPRLYRKNVACLLYKRENDKFKILIVERADSVGHWQLPQGGVDEQDLIVAGKRELSEEINTDKFKPVAVFGKLHQYEFGDHKSRLATTNGDYANIKRSKFGVEAKTASGYRGQKQGLFIAKFLGQDQNIKVNFWEHSAWRWVDSFDLLNQIHPIRRPAAKIFLEKFRQTVNG